MAMVAPAAALAGSVGAVPWPLLPPAKEAGVGGDPEGLRRLGRERRLVFTPAGRGQRPRRGERLLDRRRLDEMPGRKG